MKNATLALFRALVWAALLVAAAPGLPNDVMVGQTPESGSDLGSRRRQLRPRARQSNGSIRRRSGLMQAAATPLP